MVDEQQKINGKKEKRNESNYVWFYEWEKIMRTGNYIFVPYLKFLNVKYFTWSDFSENSLLFYFGIRLLHYISIYHIIYTIY